MRMSPFTVPETDRLAPRTVRISAVQCNWRYDGHFALAKRAHRVVQILAGSVYLIIKEYTFKSHRHKPMFGYAINYT